MSTIENTTHDQMLVAMINGIGEIDTPLRVIDNSSTKIDLGKYASEITFGNFVDYSKDTNIEIPEKNIVKEVTDLGEYAARATFGKQYTDHL